MGCDLVGDLAPEPARTGDQDATQIVTAQAHRAQNGANREASGCHQHDGGDEEQEQKDAAVGEGLELGAAGYAEPAGVEGGDAGENDGRQQLGDDQGEELFDPALAPANLIETVEIEHHRPDQQNERQQNEVAVELGNAASERHDLELEAQQPGEKEGRDGRHQVADDVEKGAGSVSLTQQASTPPNPSQHPLEGLGNPDWPELPVSVAARPGRAPF